MEVSGALLSIQEHTPEQESLKVQHNLQKESAEVTNNNDSCFLASKTVEWESAATEELRSKAVNIKLEEQCKKEVNRSPVSFIDHHRARKEEARRPPHTSQHTATYTQPATNYPPLPWQCLLPSDSNLLQVLCHEVVDLCLWA